MKKLTLVTKPLQPSPTWPDDEAEDDFEATMSRIEKSANVHFERAYVSHKLWGLIFLIESILILVIVYKYDHATPLSLYLVGVIDSLLVGFMGVLELRRAKVLKRLINSFSDQEEPK